MLTVVLKFVRMGAFGLALSLGSPSVFPCSPPLSRPLVQIPQQATEIPSNLIRFRVLDEQHANLITVRAAKRARVASRVEGGVLTIETDSTPLSDLVLSYPVEQRNGKVTLATHRFKLLPKAPLEVRAAELVVEEHGIMYPGSPQNEAAFARLRYYSPDVTGNATHLMENSVTVDGRRYQFGASATQATDTSIVEIKALCRAADGEPSGWHEDTCGNLYAVPPGKHVVTVASHILGEVKQSAPVSLEITLGCPTTPPGRGVATSGPSFASETSVIDVTAGHELGSTTQSVATSTAPSDTSSKGSRGCAVAASGQMTSVVMLALARCGFSIRRRHRGRRTRDTRLVRAVP